MKRIALITVCFSLCLLSAKAQYKFPGLDASVADIAYYPLGGVVAGKPLQVKVIYSRPLKKGREIFGPNGLQPYGKVWRVGANELTEVKFYTPVVVGGKEIPAGNYSLFAIPDKDNWTIIINGTLDRWGLFYDRDNFKEKDIVRFQVPVKPLNDVVEAMSITFTPMTGGANMVIGWDKTAVEIPIAFK